MESKILSTVRLVLGLLGAIPIAVELAGEQRVGEWLAVRLRPRLDRLRTQLAARRLLWIVAILLTSALGALVTVSVMAAGDYSILPVAILGYVGALTGYISVTRWVLKASQVALERLNTRLQSPSGSIATLVWLGATSILVAFGCQVAAVWLA